MRRVLSEEGEALLRATPVSYTHLRRGQCVHHVVLAAHAQGNMSVVTAADIDVKARKDVYKRQE